MNSVVCFAKTYPLDRDYPVGSAIQPSNNWGQAVRANSIHKTLHHCASNNNYLIILIVILIILIIILIILIILIIIIINDNNNNSSNYIALFT